MSIVINNRSYNNIDALRVKSLEDGGSISEKWFYSADKSQAKIGEPSSSEIKIITPDVNYVSLSQVTIPQINSVNLDPSKIQAGQTITIGWAGNPAALYSITGTYTNDATATEYDIRKGKIAYVKGQRLVGVLTSSGSAGEETLKISSLAQYPTRNGEGYYDYAQILDDSDVTGLKAENIVCGKTILTDLYGTFGSLAIPSQAADEASILEGKVANVYVYNEETGEESLRTAVGTIRTWPETVYNPDKNNDRTIPAQRYIAEDLVIKKVNIGPVDSQTQQVTANQMLAGTSLAVGYDGTPEGLLSITGTIPTNPNSGYTITPGTSSITLSGPSYISSDITIIGDTDLVTNNILEGITIFGVTGTLKSEETIYTELWTRIYGTPEPVAEAIF